MVGAVRRGRRGVVGFVRNVGTRMDSGGVRAGRAVAPGR